MGKSGCEGRSAKAEKRAPPRLRREGFISVASESTPPPDCTESVIQPSPRGFCPSRVHWSFLVTVNIYLCDRRTKVFVEPAPRLEMQNRCVVDKISLQVEQISTLFCPGAMAAFSVVPLLDGREFLMSTGAAEGLLHCQIKTESSHVFETQPRLCSFESPQHDHYEHTKLLHICRPCKQHVTISMLDRDFQRWFLLPCSPPADMRLCVPERLLSREVDTKIYWTVVS